MFEESKSGINFPLILALTVVATMAAVASAVVVRRRSQKVLQKVQSENTARMDELEKTLLQCRAELQAKASSDSPKIIQLPGFSTN